MPIEILWLLAGGAFCLTWCTRMVRKLPEDLRTLRESPEPTDKAVVLILWAFTAVLGMWLTGTCIGVVRGLSTVLG